MTELPQLPPFQFEQFARRLVAELQREVLPRAGDPTDDADAMAALTGRRMLGALNALGVAAGTMLASVRNKQEMRDFLVKAIDNQIFAKAPVRGRA